MNLVKTVDVSSNNAISQANLASWIAQGAQVLWVHSYHNYEHPSLKASTVQWVRLAQKSGIWTLPYTWLFRGYDPKQAVIESIQLFQTAGEDPKLIMLDCEDYQPRTTSFDPGPTPEQILAACEQARAMKAEPIVYSGNPWLTQLRQVGDVNILRGVPAIIANYNGRQDLVVPAPDYVQIIGHQYTSSPVDWSVVDLDELNRLAAIRDNPPPPPPPPDDPATVFRTAVREQLAKIASASAEIDRLLTA